jgi:hypothetical protein
MLWWLFSMGNLSVEKEYMLPSCQLGRALSDFTEFFVTEFAVVIDQSFWLDAVAVG